ncbi:LysR family transcriptional regulator [Terrarubrum flagellatum]|uniref:LysR family transcriptional regulator n=1 Tax=Terrirubrum flagellatum TaxID=2895980 RepID=UPI003145692D
MTDFAWDDFRLVRAIAQARSLAGAATALGVNPSTVFRRLGEVEERIGAKLFERHRSGYALTPAGEEMAGLADRFDEDVAAFRVKLAGRDIKPSGDLRVTMSESLLAYLVTPVLAAFRKSCIDIRLDVVVTNQSLNLSKRDADVAIRATDQPPENLVGRRIAQMGWAIYAPRPVDGAAPPTLEDAIAQSTWVALGDGFERVSAYKYVRDNVAADRIAYRVNSVLGLTEAVESGAGVGPLPCFIADARPGVVRITPVQPEFTAGLWLLTHPDLRHSPRVRVFMDFAAEALGKLKPLIEGQRPMIL